MGREHKSGTRFIHFHCERVIHSTTKALEDNGRRWRLLDGEVARGSLAPRTGKTVTPFYGITMTITLFFREGYP